MPLFSCLTDSEGMKPIFPGTLSLGILLVGNDDV
jgi:hypothetical protein